MILNESKSFNKGDRVKFVRPDTLDVMMSGTIDHKASTKEINDAGWENCTASDNFYVINTKYNGKDVKTVSPANGIHLAESSGYGIRFLSRANTGSVKVREKYFESISDRIRFINKVRNDSNFIKISEMMDPINEAPTNQDFQVYSVRFTYDGDSWSDYETNILVNGYNEKSAIENAKKGLKNNLTINNPRNFRVEKKYDSYAEYKKKYPNSNLLTFFESIDEKEISRKLDNFVGQITVDSKDEEDMKKLLLKKGVSFMIDDSRPGKLKFQLKYGKSKWESINESVDKLKKFIAYKWWQGSSGPYLNLVSLEDDTAGSHFSGWFERESLKSDLWKSQVVYTSDSESDVRDYIKKHTDKHGRLIESQTDDYIDGYGYTAYKRSNGKYEITSGEGSVVYVADSSMDAKKWMKDHKTSDKWRADGKWDWTRNTKNNKV